MKACGERIDRRFMRSVADRIERFGDPDAHMGDDQITFSQVRGT